MTGSQVTWAAVIGAAAVAAARSIGRARRHQRARPSAAWEALAAAYPPRPLDPDDFDVMLRSAGLGHMAGD